jgi:hypothetical protein
MSKYKGKRWTRRRTTRFDAKCYGPPGQIHWYVSLDGTYASVSMDIFDGEKLINLDAGGYVTDSRTQTPREFVKVRRSVSKLITELESFLTAMDTLEEDIAEEKVKYREWRNQEKAKKK